MDKKDFERISRDSLTEGEAFERLTEIIRYLRSEEGCPWDKVQTHESLRKCLIEESYEVIDAINRKNSELLEEELGDLILQGVFHGLIAEDDKNFDLISVLNRVSNKMIFRHPHVFLRENAENEAETLDKALIKWENMKHQEKRQKSQTQVMNDIPKELPALMRSYKIQKKAREVGFDWDNVKEAFKKVKEEIGELEEICAEGSREHIMEELGDVLFSVVNVARFLDVDPEEALNFTSEKFIRRFEYIENNAVLQNRELTDMTLEEMDRLWDEAKDREK
ncbi:MAG: nucleoside triphosphate pyrophosphohydrolase [Bacillota bacterium]|nr:nucleoside triphosphate pyrophosphohydrolase [Bacillota bacterium]